MRLVGVLQTLDSPDPRTQFLFVSYDRYWMGRTAWGDVIRNTRTLGRLVWFHVPLCLTVKTPEEARTGQLNRPVSELNKVMTEKRMAMDLIEGCVCLTMASISYS